MQIDRLFFKKTRKQAFIFFIISQIFFLIKIQFPKTLNFDEFHYVPSAKQWISFQKNQNWEHPPLAKLLIALGVGILGDRPIGWRYMSTLFGSLTLVGMYYCAWVLFKSEKTAIWVTLLTLSNHLLYVQSRIAMLDTFMFCFLLWAIVFFMAAWNPAYSEKKIRIFFKTSGILFGLAIASKWFAIVPWVASWALLLFFVCFKKYAVDFKTNTIVHHSQLQNSLLFYKKLHIKNLIVDFLLYPCMSYFITFTPYLFVPSTIHSFMDILKVQIQMFSGQLHVTQAHPYMSHWRDWVLLRRPIWYAFDREGPYQQWVRGVFCIGNPLMMWTGVLALGKCIKDFYIKKNWDAFLITYFYCVCYLSWFLIPRRITFYYYYYPAGMFLSFAIAYYFHHKENKKNISQWIYLGLSFGFLIHFFPILSGSRIPLALFRKWMWFRSWI